MSKGKRQVIRSGKLGEKNLPIATLPTHTTGGNNERLLSWKLNEDILGTLNSPTPSLESAMLLGTKDPMEIGRAQLQAVTLGLFSSVEEPRSTGFL